MDSSALALRVVLGRVLLWVLWWRYTPWLKKWVKPAHAPGGGVVGEVFLVGSLVGSAAEGDGWFLGLGEDGFAAHAPEGRRRRGAP